MGPLFMSQNLKYFFYVVLTITFMTLTNTALAKIPQGDDSPKSNDTQPRHMVIMSPLVGINRATIKRPAAGPHPATQSSDTEIEYGLSTIYRGPRVSVSNVLFMTDFNDSEIYGSVGFVNLYSNDREPWAINIGGGYIWHKIESKANDITIQAPMIKAGLVRRWPKHHLSLNPYLGFSWEEVATSHSDSRSESILYGISSAFQWKSVHYHLQYHLEDKIDNDNYYNVARLRITVPVSNNLGITARFEYMEHETIDNRSILVGPSWIF